MSQVVPYQHPISQNLPPYSQATSWCLTNTWCISPEVINKTSMILEGIQNLATPIFKAIGEPIKGLAFRHSSGLWAAASGVLFASGMTHFVKAGASGAYAITSAALSGVIMAAAYQQEIEDTSLLPYFFLGGTLLMNFREIKNLNNQLVVLQKSKQEKATTQKTKSSVRFESSEVGKPKELSKREVLKEKGSFVPLVFGRGRPRNALVVHSEDESVEPGAVKIEESRGAAEKKWCCRRWYRK
jgi:hypothetical protein